MKLKEYTSQSKSSNRYGGSVVSTNYQTSKSIYANSSFKASPERRVSRDKNLLNYSSAFSKSSVASVSFKVSKARKRGKIPQGKLNLSSYATT